MAGVLGFEPRYAGIKTLCLTAWRHPYVIYLQRIVQWFFFDVKLNLTPMRVSNRPTANVKFDHNSIAL
jgi:hypothetical protein